MPPLLATSSIADANTHTHTHDRLTVIDSRDGAVSSTNRIIVVERCWGATSVLNNQSQQPITNSSQIINNNNTLADY